MLAIPKYPSPLKVGFWNTMRKNDGLMDLLIKQVSGKKSVSEPFTNKEKKIQHISEYPCYS